MVRHDHRLVAGNRHAAIRARSAFAEDAFVMRLAVTPELTPRRRIERVPFVPAADVHDAVHHRRRHFEARRRGHRKNPRGPDALDVRRVDLLDRAETIAGHAAVVHQPVGLRRDRLLAVDVAVARQQHKFAVFQERGIEVGLRQQDPRAGLAVRHLDRGGRRSSDARAWRGCCRRRGWRGCGRRRGISGGSRRSPRSTTSAAAASSGRRSRSAWTRAASAATGIAAGGHRGICSGDEAHIGQHLPQLRVRNLQRRMFLADLGRGFGVRVIAHVGQNRRPGCAGHGSAVTARATRVIRGGGRPRLLRGRDHGQHDEERHSQKKGVCGSHEGLRWGRV